MCLNLKIRAQRSDAVKLMFMEIRSLANVDCVVMETAPNPSTSIIWLHGLGADAHDFVPIVPHLAHTQAQAVRFIFPQAPVRPVTVNGGMPMRAWYDILGVDIDRNQDQSGIHQSVEAMHQLIDHEQARNSSHQVVMAGFSQGGAIALRAGLASATPIAGVMGLSTYLLGAEGIGEWVHPDRLGCPIYLAHGEKDPIVPVQLAQQSRDALVGFGFNVQWQTWPMGHEVCQPEIGAIDLFLSQCHQVAH